MKVEKKNILTIFFWLISVLVEAFIAFLILEVMDRMCSDAYWFILKTALYMLIGGAVILYKRSKENKQLLQFKPFKVSTVLKIFLIDITAIALLQWGGFRGFNNFQNLVQKSFVYFFNRFTGKESFTLYTIFRAYFKPSSLHIQYFITTITIAPIYEELMFRGVIYEDTKKLFNAKIAAVVSSVLFSLIHIEGGYSYIVGTLLSGFLLVYCYEKTKSLYAPILFHSLHNFTSAIIQNIFDWHAYVMLLLIYVLACIIMLFVEAGRYIAKRKKTMLCKQE